MNDLNWKSWGLIFLLVIGITFEAIKRLPKDVVNLTAEKLKFISAESGPYQVHHPRVKKGAPALLPPPKHAAALAAVNRETIEKFIAANKSHTTEFKPPTEAEKAAADKAKKSKPLAPDEEWELVFDAKTGKTLKRRKKKVAKIEEVKVETAQQETKKEEPKKDDDVDAVLNEAIANGGLPPVDTSGLNPQADFDEWKHRLLDGRPDPAEVRRFVDLYKQGAVSVDVFYKIVTAMLEDSRPAMKELGVLCAGLTPSVLSFQVLAEVIKEKSSGSSLRKYTESFLAQYAAVDKLVYLNRVLRTPASSFMALQAMKRLEDSANNYLAPSKNKPPKNASAASLGKHSNSSYFAPFVPTLSGLLKNPDGQVKDLASATLNNLNHLMNMSNAPNTIAPNNSAPAAQASAL